MRQPQLRDQLEGHDKTEGSRNLRQTAAKRTKANRKSASKQDDLGQIDNVSLPNGTRDPKEQGHPANPICVDDYAWSTGWSNKTKRSRLGSSSSTSSQDDSQVTLPSTSKTSYVPSPSISPEPSNKRQYSLSRSISPEPRNGVQRKSGEVDGGRSSKRRKDFVVEVPMLSASDRSKYRRVSPGPPTANQTPARESMLRAWLSRESTVMSETPFLIPFGEEELWRDVGAEDAREAEAVEYIIVHDTPPPDLRPKLKKLPLSAYVGKDTLLWHARMEPRSLAFRKTLVAAELGDRDYLLDGGVEAAAEMFQRVGIATPPDLDRIMQRRNKKNLLLSRS